MANYKFDDIIIIINSSHRADKVRTTTKFPKKCIKYLLAVPKKQVQEYKKYNKCEIYPIPKTVANFLPSQRQHCIEHFSKKYKYVWFMDDDLSFFIRVNKKLIKVVKKDVKQMFAFMHNHVQQVPLVGISTRLGNNYVVDDYTDITRITRCYAVDTDVFKKVGVTFAPFEPFVSEDFHIALSFLNAGYKTRALHKYAQDDVGSNADGGCSLYRNFEVQKKTAFWMAEHHPEVSVRVKKANNWKGFDKYRVDMTIAWKKAYKPKRKKSDWLKK